MAKALMGLYATPETIRLLDEIRALRARVTELEEALEEAEVARRGRDQSARQGDDQPDEGVVTLDPVEPVNA